MRKKNLLKPAAAFAACLALLLAGSTALPALQNSASRPVAGNQFTVTAYAQELTKTTKVFSDKYDSLYGGFETTDDGGICFSFGFPVTCKGENIDTITYTINRGAFQISNPKGKGIVLNGQEIPERVNAPASSTETDDDGIVPYEWKQYRSFTVGYQNQTNDKTVIEIVDSSDFWDEAKLNEYKTSNYEAAMPFQTKEYKRLCDFLTKDIEITCMVTYQDGSSQEAQIAVSNEVIKLAELKGAPSGADGREIVVGCFSIR